MITYVHLNASVILHIHYVVLVTHRLTRCIPQPQRVIVARPPVPSQRTRGEDFRPLGAVRPEHTKDGLGAAQRTVVPPGANYRLGRFYRTVIALGTSCGVRCANRAVGSPGADLHLFVLRGRDARIGQWQQGGGGGCIRK